MPTGSEPVAAFGRRYRSSSSKDSESEPEPRLGLEAREGTASTTQTVHLVKTPGKNEKLCPVTNWKIM